MISNLSGSAERYLNALNTMQTRLDQAQAEIGSGLRVNQASDDPAAVGSILDTQARIGSMQQTETNLATVKTEADTADGALQSAISALESALSSGAQGASSTATADLRTNLATQVQSVLQTLVSISQTTVNGRYIFSGDQDTKPSYQMDLTQPTGVTQLQAATATRTVLDANGVPIPVDKTAQEIFDARNADGTAASGNVFAAVNALRVALANNDTAGISQAMDDLHTADTYINNQLSFYGNLQNQVQQNTGLAQSYETTGKQNLSQLRDADIPTVAEELTQVQVQQQAALSAQASISHQKNLFDYLA
jgi:flagellar hook-associated protein 3 FlgL